MWWPYEKHTWRLGLGNSGNGPVGSFLDFKNCTWRTIILSRDMEDFASRAGRTKTSIYYIYILSKCNSLLILLVHIQIYFDSSICFPSLMARISALATFLNWDARNQLRTISKWNEAKPVGDASVVQYKLCCIGETSRSGVYKRALPPYEIGAVRVEKSDGPAGYDGCKGSTHGCLCP